MSKTVIRIKGLSKIYRLGASYHPTLRGTLSNIFKKNGRYNEFWALKDVDLEIKEGEVLGIIGKNGAGKSTLLKILSRITYPTKGKAEIYGRVTSLLEVGTGFHPELTGRENIYLNGSLLGMTRTEISKNFDEIVQFSGIEKFIDTPVKNYSSGMYVRLAFSVAAHLNSEILLIDEVLAVGDYEFQQKCLGKMNDVVDSGKTILFVSHDLTAIQSLAKRVLLVENGKCKSFNSFDQAIINYKPDHVMLNKKYEDGSIVKSIKLKVDLNITIEVQYSFPNDPIIPHFGFIISNYLKLPIFGTNPTVEKISLNKKYKKEGKVIVIIEQPILSSGSYSISIWMGDGNKDLFLDEYCLYFNVPNKKMTEHLGFITPQCKYIYK